MYFIDEHFFILKKVLCKSGYLKTNLIKNKIVEYFKSMLL